MTLRSFSKLLQEYINSFLQKIRLINYVTININIDTF